MIGVCPTRALENLITRQSAVNEVSDGDDNAEEHESEAMQFASLKRIAGVTEHYDE